MHAGTISMEIEEINNGLKSTMLIIGRRVELNKLMVRLVSQGSGCLAIIWCFYYQTSCQGNINEKV